VRAVRVRANISRSLAEFGRRVAGCSAEPIQRHLALEWRLSAPVSIERTTGATPHRPRAPMMCAPRSCSAPRILIAAPISARGQHNCPKKS